MKAHTISSFTVAAALAALGAGCASTNAPSGAYSQSPNGSYPETREPNHTARSAAVGAAAGAVLGGIIGNNSEHGTGKGAAVGAVAGGLAGAAIGHRTDQRDAAQVYSPDAGYTVQSVPAAPVSEPQETIPPQPSPNAVWIRGYYDYTGSGYQWQPGHWESAPAGGRAWVQPSWQRASNGGYIYVRGHWQ